MLKEYYYMYCCIVAEFRGKVGQIVSMGDKYLATVEENKVSIKMC